MVSSRYHPRPLVNSMSYNYYVQPSVSVRNLGMLVDHCLSLKKHVSSICKSAFFHIRRIAKVRKYLSEKSTAALVNALGIRFYTVYLVILSKGYKHCRIAVITVEPADKISFVYNSMQTRRRGQYNVK